MKIPEINFSLSMWLAFAVLTFIGALVFATEKVKVDQNNLPPAFAVPEFDLRNDSYYFSNEATRKLIRAAEKVDLALAKKLVAEGADPNDTGPKDNPSNQFSVLHIMIAKNDTKAIKILIEVGAKVDLDVKVGVAGSPLIWAVHLEKVDALKTILDTVKIENIDQKIVSTSFFHAAHFGRPGSIKVFLDRGVSIDLQDLAGYTIFMRAIGAFDFELASWLLSLGASYDIETVGGATPRNLIELMMSRYKPDNEIYKKAAALRDEMKAKGAVFPAPSAKEIKAKRAKK